MNLSVRLRVFKLQSSLWLNFKRILKALILRFVIRARLTACFCKARGDEKRIIKCALSFFVMMSKNALYFCMVIKNSVLSFLR